MCDIIIGIREVAKKFDRGITTIKRWDKKEAFPLSYLPDGSRVTTQSLIDEWLMARREVKRASASASLNNPQHNHGSPQNR